MDKRYDDIYKRTIVGDSCCPFWRVEGDGTCAALPKRGCFACPADRDGCGCVVFPN